MRCAPAATRSRVSPIRSAPAARTPTVRSALVDCGFVSARLYGELRGSDCPDPDCPTAESIPPADPYAVNSTGFETGALTLQKLQTWVTQAENNGGGWVPVVFHDICNACDDASVSQSVFQAFLDWLQPRAANGTIVKTMREVMLMNPGYLRPKGATPFRVPLVPAYDACAAPDTTHGGPLAFDSCRSPHESSGFLTVGTSDANGKPARSIGSLTLRTIVGNPVTTTDEADVRIDLSLTDVRKRTDLSDYTAELTAVPRIRLTDRLNGPQQTEPGTTSDFDFDFAVPCAGTSDTTVGSTCSLSTTADALKPGMAKEGRPRGLGPRQGPDRRRRAGRHRLDQEQHAFRRSGPVRSLRPPARITAASSPLRALSARL